MMPMSRMKNTGATIANSIAAFALRLSARQRARVARSRVLTFPMDGSHALHDTAALSLFPARTFTPLVVLAEGQASNVVNNRLTECADSTSNGYGSGAPFMLR